MKKLEMCFYLNGWISKEEMYVVNETTNKVYLCDRENPNKYNDDTIYEFDKVTGECLNDNDFLGARRYLEV